MIKSLIVITALSAMPVAVPQPIEPTFFSFDYDDAEFEADTVSRFEMQIDTGAWTSVGIPTLTLPMAGGKTYQVLIPAVTPGTHAVGFRACDLSACSGGSIPFGFKVVVTPVD
jgi:hypothetical protein